MKTAFKSLSLALGLSIAATVAANANLIDFTDESTFTVVDATTLSGSEGGGWTGTAFGGPITLATPGPGATGVLQGENDGIGITDDEITAHIESFTVTFNSIVTITGLFFLDLFIPEVAQVSVDGGPVISFASLVGLNPGDPGYDGGTGYNAFTGLSLTGMSFTFTVDDPNEVGQPDYALAGIQLAAIPVPAGLLLLGSALGALGLRRRRKAA